MTTLTPQVRDRSVVQNPKLSIRDLFEEMISGLLGRPGRLALTALGTVLGITALVSTLGLAKTAGNQIVSRFDELTETRIVVSPAENGFGGSDATSSVLLDSMASKQREPKVTLTSRVRCLGLFRLSIRWVSTNIRSTW